jgi:isochorismate synthase
VEETGPFTKRAADLVHLCSDFHAVTNGTKAVGEIVASLHPTPAVCGLPKWEARELLLRSEPASRHFYSGFCGPLNIDSQTKLFVSLRCMEIGSDGYRLYAGGGLLKDSVEEQEWQETEAKMQTMRRLL